MIGSVDGIRVPRMETYAYSSSKAALHQLSRVFAAQLGRRGVTCNTLACGMFVLFLCPCGGGHIAALEWSGKGRGGAVPQIHTPTLTLSCLLPQVRSKRKVRLYLYRPHIIQEH